ncbi:Type 1 glutamine amidotransferase-like domain-containing protein [Shewanella benthica]|uniref:Type 1 glutamine amidotransferase-like domain-containing protein n=1 Tax=Shewanella benthica TaxID=43661 RepID=UPI00187A9A33|nr:Type 1 glutamine amidotransferase-like domain-containing protein [Shewanella benthica]MBE7214831.1 Type 1 glutamine amidotransferase-like domain-containing protein [Shewanella benthica]MCL1061873.1 Type 1 glutamine amidotransferase-like domain-containing protein [Shewanella benthica]
MKLALVSDPDTGNGIAGIKYVLDALGTSSKRIGYIASQPDPVRDYYLATQHMYSKLGDKLDCYLELESGFNETSLKQLLACDAIHLSGGDTYRFLKWLKYRDLLPVLNQYVTDGGALIGVSAGAMIMTPSIDTAILCGDANYVGLQDLSGLSLVPFHFVPHVSLAEKTSVVAMELAAISADLSRVYFCGDNTSLVIIDGELVELGEPFLWVMNEIKPA